MNLALDHMPDWWPSRFFPETVQIDAARFWSTERTFAELEQHGFAVDLRIEYRKHYEPDDQLVEAKNQDMSQLAMLDDDVFDAGLERLEAEPAGLIMNELAFLDVRATATDAEVAI